MCIKRAVITGSQSYHAILILSSRCIALFHCTQRLWRHDWEVTLLWKMLFFLWCPCILRIESLIYLHSEVSCITVIVFSFESRTCLESKCLIYLPIFFSSSMIFLMKVSMSQRQEKDSRKAEGSVLGSLLLRVYEGRSCFITPWKIR